MTISIISNSDIQYLIEKVSIVIENMIKLACQQRFQQKVINPFICLCSDFSLFH